MNAKKTSSRSEFPVAKMSLILGLALLLTAEGFFGYRLRELSARQETIKADHANINNISFGLLSVENWRNQVSGIINRQVKHFKLSKTQKNSYKLR